MVPGEHEHRAGCMLLADQLNTHMKGTVLATVYGGGWPNDPSALDNVDAVVSFTDGGGGHPLNYHLKELGAAMDRGVGLGCIHYAVETLADEPGKRFLDWIGGYFETNWSVNPHWTARFEKLPEHAVTRGVKPFETQGRVVLPHAVSRGNGRRDADPHRPPAKGDPQAPGRPAQRQSGCPSGRGSRRAPTHDVGGHAGR